MSCIAYKSSISTAYLFAYNLLIYIHYYGIVSTPLIWVTGSAQPKLTADNLANVEIREPPSNDQDEIAEYIKNHCTIVEGIVSKIYSDIRLFYEYRTALISEAVTGKNRRKRYGHFGLMILGFL